MVKMWTIFSFGPTWCWSHLGAMLQLEQIYIWGTQPKKWQHAAMILYDTHHTAKLLEKFETAVLQHCRCVDKFSSLPCWMSVRISGKTACWNIWPNICLILPCFTAHQIHTPPPARHRQGRHPLWPLNPTRRGGRCQTSCPSQRGGSESSSLFSFHFCTGPLQ